MNIRKYFLAICMLLMAAAPLSSFAQSGSAKRTVVSAPVIDNFYVTPEDQITAGTELTFTVEGTPRGKASVRISGINRTINLREVDPGVYEGSYTINSRDRLSARTSMHATLRVRNVSTVQKQPLYSAGALAGTAPTPVPVPATTTRQPVMLVIDRFFSATMNKIEPGADLKFILNGTPGAKAAFSIDGVTKDVAMQETRSGHYEGTYTVRRADNFPASTNITATLQINGQAVRTRLNQALVSDARPPVIKNLSPRDNETVGGNLVLVSATFEDIGGVGVDAKNIRVIVDGNDVTRNATVTAQYFNYRADLTPGRHSAEVIVKDLSGNMVRQSWNFVVGQAVPTSLPLSITNHSNNSQVGPGSVEVRGMTAPDARLDVQVQAVAAVAGMFGLTQQVYDQSMRSDASGYFAFTFQPQVAVPGTRYEININATKGDLQNQLKITLHQQK